jgi:hypothetical protein
MDIKLERAFIIGKKISSIARVVMGIFNFLYDFKIIILNFKIRIIALNYSCDY